MEKNIKKTPEKKPMVKEVTVVKTGEFAFGKNNYRLVLIGLGFIALGFILMIGGGSKDPKVFNPAIFDFQRITLAPVLVLIGYIIELFAIMIKPKE
ncbi:MAG: DUF3098 domain-containing protein [Syntrophothermus sp.]